MSHPRRLVLACTAALALTAVGCPRPPPPSPPIGRAFGDRCDDASVTQQPDLMGLSMDFRANIATTRQQGALAVRYYATDTCEVKLEVLPNCIGPKIKYAFAAYAGNESRVASNKLELFAKLPLGAAALEGKLVDGHSLRTDYMLAGMLTLPIGERFDRDDLDGQDCSRATHIVNRIYVGGFALASGQSREIQAAATIFGVGVGGGHMAAGEVFATEGVQGECAKAQASGAFSEQCQVPLRLGLLALSDYDADAYAPDAEGFVPLLVVDENRCRVNEEVWNGTHCESLSAPRAKPSDLMFRDEHGCVMGQQVWNGRCVDGDGHEIYDSLTLTPAAKPQKP